MNYFITRARPLVRYKNVISNGIGVFNSQKWQPFLQNFLLGRWSMHANCYMTLGRNIRQASHINQPFFIFAKRNVHPFVNDGQNRLYSKEVNFQNLQPRAKRRVLYTSLKILKALCFIMGISTWILLLLFLLVGDELNFREKHIIEAMPSNYWEIVRKYKFLRILDSEHFLIPHIQDDDDKEVVADEVLHKIDGFYDILMKILSDDRVQTSLGNSVEKCGYKCSGNIGTGFPYNINELERKTKWVASCYIEGSNGMAVLHILFERHNTQSQWVATKLHLQRINKSGEVLCNLSSSLLNGLSHFTRLSDVKDLPE